MTRHIFILLIISSTIARGQNNLDTIQIDKQLKNNNTSDKSLIDDIKIIKTIQAFDDNFYKIVGYYKLPPYKNTIIRSGTIQVRQLIDKDKILKIILSDSLRFKKDIAAWNKSNHDTTKFLSDLLIQNDQFEFSEFYDYKSKLLEVFKELVTTISPLTIPQSVNLTNIIFYTDKLNSTVDLIARKLNQKTRPVFYKYLKDNYDEFHDDDKRLDSKAIYISSITFSIDNLVYVGVDIYGRHHLLTFDSSDNWRFINRKALWIY